MSILQNNNVLLFIYIINSMCQFRKYVTVLINLLIILVIPNEEVLEQIRCNGIIQIFYYHNILVRSITWEFL